MRKILSFILCFFIGNYCWCSVEFDGTDDFVTFGDTAFTGGMSEWTVSVWIKLNTLGVSERILAKWGSSSSVQDFLISLDDTNSDELILAHRNASAGITVRTTSDANLTTDTWYNIVWIGSSTPGNYACYRDGTALSLNAVASAGGTVKDSATALYWGSDANATAYSDSTMLDLAFWDTSLTTDEINNLGSKVRGMPLQIKKANLQMYIPGDDYSAGTALNGSSIPDYSGNSNNGTGDDGANNTGMTAASDEVLTYPWDAFLVTRDTAAAPAVTPQIIMINIS